MTEDSSLAKVLRNIERLSYPLIFLPFLTEYIESGKVARTPRELVTEGVVGVLLLFYIFVIRRGRKRMESLERDRKNLTALLLHDMKTPLAVVMGTLSYLEKHPDDVEQGKWIRMALKNCREDLELMDQLMEVDQLEVKGLPLTKREVDFPELLRTCAEEISAIAAMKGIAFLSSYGEDVSRVMADEGLLRRVLMNLMRNAIKFTKSGGRLDVRAEVLEKDLVVTVKDTGIGIPPGEMKKLFSRFARVQNTHGQGQQGWGLGLYFCKLAVEAHGGRIEADSQFGEGTHVRFSIPLVLPPLPISQRGVLVNTGFGI